MALPRKARIIAWLPVFEELVLTGNLKCNRSVPLGLILPEVPLSKVFSGKNLREGERLP